MFSGVKTPENNNNIVLKLRHMLCFVRVHISKGALGWPDDWSNRSWVTWPCKKSSASCRCPIWRIWANHHHWGQSVGTI